MRLPRRHVPRWFLGLDPTIFSPATATGGGLNYQVGTETFAIERRPKDVDTAKRPVVVLLHGVDGLSELSRTQILAFAEELDKAGYVAFVPTYFGSNDGSVGGFPDESDIKARIDRLSQYAPRVAEAVKVARSQPDAEPDRVALVGFSLGGGLALERAEASPGDIKAVADFFGYIGSKLIYDNAAKLPPTVVFHNPKDGIVDPEYSKKLLEALGKTPVKHANHFLDDDNPLVKNHPFKPGGTADKKSRELTLEWLKTYL
jgi:carboxymethylenebutenolidase